MPKKGSNPRGGAGRSVEVKAVVAGVSFTPELLAVIDALPQVASKEWSRSYLIGQVLINWLGLPADYDCSDLDVVAKGGIVE
jgi:hypothetical protein